MARRLPVAPSRRKKRTSTDPNTLTRVKPSMHRVVGEEESVIERRAMALSLRQKGYSYRDIAKAPSMVALNAGAPMSPNTIYDYIQAELMALREQTTLDSESVREMELGRLDLLIKSMFPRALKGDIGAGLAVLKVLESRRKLLGVDAPEKMLMGAMVGNLTPDVAARMSETEIMDRIQRLIGAAESATVKTLDQVG